MSEQSKDLSQVEELLAERDAVHGWLAKLDSSPGAISEAVKERVRSDYNDRLDGITAELGTHADAIAAKLAVDRAEHAELSELMKVSGDALAEVELRHTVGEFDDERFESERGKHVGDLESFELSLAAVDERIARLEDVEALISRDPVPTAEPAPELEVELVEEPVAEEEAVAEEEPVSEETPVDIEELMVAENDEDEPDEVEAGDEAEPTDTEPVPSMAEKLAGPDAEDLLSVFGESMTIEPEDLPEEPPEDPDASPLQLDEVPDRPDNDMMSDFGPLSFTRSGELPVSKARPAPPPMGMPATDQAPKFVRPGTKRGSELSEPNIDDGKEPEESAPESTPSAAPKDDNAVERTLRCGECGSMNRPLEWYCEKCGAELTAI